MNVKVIFPKNSQPDIAKAKVAERICQAAFLYIDLPEAIEIEFCDLGASYGESVVRNDNKKRIRLHSHLRITELIYPLVHELIHVNQMHKGRLAVTRFGDCVWEGKIYKLTESKLSYQEYKQLPWEQDVANREKALLVKILK